MDPKSNQLNLKEVYIILVPKIKITINDIKSYFKNYNFIWNFEINKDKNKYYINFQTNWDYNYNLNDLGLNKIQTKNIHNIINCVKLQGFKEKSFIKVFNFCSSFGNINEIYKNKVNTSELIINFTNIKNAIIFKKIIHGFKYNNIILKVNYFKKFIYDKKIYDIFVVENKYQRHNSNFYFNINTPSNLIFFYNLKKACTLMEFSKLISKKFDNYKLKILSQKKGLLSYLVKFDKLDSAIQALMYFHNKINNDYIIKASFSHSNFG